MHIPHVAPPSSAAALCCQMLTQPTRRNVRVISIPRERSALAPGATASSARHTPHITSSRALKCPQLQQPVVASLASALPSAALSSRTLHARTPGESRNAYQRGYVCHITHSCFSTATADVADISGIHLSASNATASSSDGRLLGAAAAQGQDQSAGLLNVEMLLRFVSAR